MAAENILTLAAIISYNFFATQNETIFMHKHVYM